MDSLTERFFFPFLRLQNGNSDLISVNSSEGGPPAKHPPPLRSYGGTGLFGLSRAEPSPGLGRKRRGLPAA